MADDAPGGNAGGGGAFTKKVGAFPLWVWMGLGLAGLLAISNWKKNKAAASQTASSQTSLGAAGQTGQTYANSYDASLIPQFVNQTYTEVAPPVVNINQSQTQTQPTDNGDHDHWHAPPPPPSPQPTPQPAPNPTPQPPAGQWVTVAPWSSVNAPWNSTLWGIAQHTYGNGALYPKIFAANKTGVVRPDGTSGTINNPKLIYPGQRIWVPA